MRRLLLIEDEDVIRRALEKLLQRHRYAVTGVATIEAAKVTPLHLFDLVLADIRLPGDPGTAIIPLVDPVPVVLMTSHASVRSAVEAMRAGATDYVAKPFDHEELLLVLDRALQRERLALENRALRAELARRDPPDARLRGTALEALLHGASPAANAPPATPFGTHSGTTEHRFFHGESGSGREALARALQRQGPRARGPWRVLDGAAPRRPAPTGPPGSEHARDESGLRATLRASRHGTLLARHPELLPVAEREALMQAIVDDDQDVVLFALAGQSLERLVAGGLLEPDFAALFTGPAIEIPPLRYRRADAVLLARRVVAACAGRRARRGLHLSDAAEAWIAARDWPGNLLELEHVVGCAAALVADERIEPADLAGATGTRASPLPDTLSLDAYFRWFVLRHGETLSETELAARLGISRKSLWERRRRMRLPRGESDG